MIVNPDKGLFFVATALMCSVSLYAAELSTAEPDPMTRIFVGEPSHLTLPPGFPAMETADGGNGCVSTAATRVDQPVLERASSNIGNSGCDAGPSTAPVNAVSAPRGPSAAGAKADIAAQPISLGSADRIH